MPWRQERYYVRNVKRAGCVVTQYVGKDELGETAAADDTRRSADRATKRAERAVMLARSAALDDFFVTVERLVRAALEAAGYHRHDRGTWRKRRVTTKEEGTTAGPADA